MRIKCPLSVLRPCNYCVLLHKDGSFIHTGCIGHLDACWISKWRQVALQTSQFIVFLFLFFVAVRDGRVYGQFVCLRNVLYLILLAKIMKTKNINTGILNFICIHHDKWIQHLYTWYSLKYVKKQLMNEKLLCFRCITYYINIRRD